MRKYLHDVGIDKKAFQENMRSTEVVNRLTKVLLEYKKGEAFVQQILILRYSKKCTLCILHQRNVMESATQQVMLAKKERLAIPTGVH